MTREEAIKVLRTESVEIGGNAVIVRRFFKAIDTALEALLELDMAEKGFGKNRTANRRKPEEDDHDERKENENV